MYFNMNGTNKGVDYGLVTLEIQSPPLMPVGLNSNGRTLPGRHGVAASPPGSQVFAHMRSLNNNTLPVWVYCLWRAAAMTRWCHHQYARWGSLSPLVRCLMKEGFKGCLGGRGLWDKKYAFQLPLMPFWSSALDNLWGSRPTRSNNVTWTLTSRCLLRFWFDHLMTIAVMLMAILRYHIKVKRTATTTL